METVKFEELQLDDRILRAVTDMGFEEASPIQAKAIPVELEGSDIIGQAQTGTGKTAAFGIPLLQKIDPKKKKLQAIQEAAVQAVQENYAETPHVEAQVAMMIANQAANNDNQVSIQQVRQQLEEEYPLAAVPFDDYVEKSDVLDYAQQPVTVTPARIRRMESRSLRTANGIEVKIPTELLNAESEVEFLHADDGSISLLIKNVIL